MIVVVGGGITGLATARALVRRGLQVRVLEADDRTGGVIRSRTVEGRVLDWGPQRTRLTGAIRGLVDELDLGPELLTAPTRPDLLIYRDGSLRVVPFDPWTFITSDVVSFRGKLRLLLEPLTGGVREGERVARFFERKLGREVYEVIVAPLYGGLYASDPAEMVVDLSLIHVLREFGIGRSLLLPLLRRGGRIAPPPAVSFGAGMATLPTALGNALGERVHLRTRAIDLVRTGTGWRVRADRAGRAVEIEARQVVLAVPAPAAARLLEGESPGLSSRIARLRYNPLGVVHLEADTPLEGLGFQVSFTERNRALRGVTFNHSLFGRERLYTAYLGGALRPDVRDWSTERLGREAVREFRETTGYESRVLSAEHESVPAWDITWRGLRAETIPPGLWLAGNWWSRPGIPGRLAEAERIAAGVVADASGMERGR